MMRSKLGGKTAGGGLGNAGSIPASSISTDWYQLLRRLDRQITKLDFRIMIESMYHDKKPLEKLKGERFCLDMARKNCRAQLKRY